MRTSKTNTLSGYGRPEVRFWKRVDKNGPIHINLGPCWTWTGGKYKSGYGYLNVGEGMVRAHRFSWELHFGPIPEGLSVLHKCDNPPCVNPEHLFLGTSQDNHDDQASKGRQPIGEQNSNARLTEEQVRQIRSLYRWRHSEFGSFGLARRFGVGQYAIMCVIHRKTWKHI